MRAIVDVFMYMRVIGYACKHKVKNTPIKHL